MMHKRICFFLYNLFGLGGIQRVVSVLASELSKEYDVYIQCYDDPKEENREIYNLSQDVHVIYLERSNKQSMIRKGMRKINQKYGILSKIHIVALVEWAYLLPIDQKNYSNIIKENNIDIAIGVGGFETAILASISKEVRCKTIGWQHSSYKAYFETKGMACWGMDSIVEKYFPMLDEYVVLNKYDQDEFFRKKGYSCKTIFNPKSFVSEKRSLLQEKKFIAAGRFIYAKGFDLLIDSFKIFAERDDEWTLTIYGEGENYETIKEKVNEYGLDNRVFLPGFSNNMIENLLSASCYLLSSRWEGMPMVVLEAIEMGVPVVAYDISAMLPLVVNEEEGLIVPQFDTIAFAEAMLRISKDFQLRMRLGRNAKEKSSLFSKETIANQWSQLFHSMLCEAK